MVFDILGSLASLLSTYYFIRLKSTAWPIGMGATVLNGWLYWSKGIYADMSLEGIYFLGMCYGWYLWRLSGTQSNEKNKLPADLSFRQWYCLLITLICIFILIYWFLKTATTSNVAILDAITTSLSLCAQWLMMHKYRSTWILWFITDGLYASLYLYKQLPVHSVLMVLYTLLAVSGYKAWKKQVAYTAPTFA